MDGKRKPSADGRAWIEVDLNALAYNLNTLRSRLPATCGIMAVVKADAYGHGAANTALRLQAEGVGSFAVATAGEGAGLREEGIGGEILVLGYTRPSDAGVLSDYDLSQLVIDGEYAKALNDTGNPLRTHIAIDTGMHRLGIDSTDLTQIESVYRCGNLTVDGVATHLASADSFDPAEIDFTELQIKRFYRAVDSIKSSGYDPGKLHIQASYGVFNYSGLHCDLARLGIALYGVMSHGERVKTKIDLQPVLALKARVAQVRRISAGETVSYGRSFKAESPVKLATVCAGYSDGIPRQMSGNGGQCIIRGQKAPIVGRICMDMLMADVTRIDDARQGDIATLIGRDGGEEIRCEDVARRSGTITNDILCRLGSRLQRVYT